MALHVTLVRNFLKGEVALRPRIVHADTVEMDVLLHYMANGTALGEADMRAVISRLHEALVFYLTLGRKVRTPLGTFRLSAHGTCAAGQTPRVESRNIGVKFRPTRGFLASLRSRTKIVMVETDERQLPSITTIQNVEAPERVNEGTAGQIIKVKGARLSFDPADEELGVFLVAEGGTCHRMSVYSRAGTARIDFKLAEVPAGSYTLEVRTRPSRRDVWVGSARDPLIVRR